MAMGPIDEAIGCAAKRAAAVHRVALKIGPVR